MTVRACHKRILSTSSAAAASSSSPSRLPLAAAVRREAPMPESGLAATYLGHVGSTKDALIIIEACLSGYLNHLGRRPRLSEEWSLSQSGNIFVYEARSSGVTTWRDGIAWSEPIRVGNFELRQQLASPASRSHRTNGVCACVWAEPLTPVRRWMMDANQANLFQGHTAPAGSAEEPSVPPSAA